MRLQADGEPAVLRWYSQRTLNRCLTITLRADVHRRCVVGLRSGGVMLLEASCTPRQLGHGTGGRPLAELMMNEETLSAELAGLEFLNLQECEREIHEGAFHNGLGAVVQVVGGSNPLARQKYQ